MKFRPLFLIIFLAGFMAKGQESLNLSLQEAIDYALENSYATINANRDIDIAKKKNWETIATGLPQIDANVEYSNWIKQQVSLIPSEFFGGQPGEFEEVVFGTQQSMNATATLRQLIFDGSYIVGVQFTDTYLQISENAKEKTEQGVREAVINAYGNVLFSEEGLAIVDRNITSVAKTLNETEQIFANGLTEEESVEQLEITLAQLEILRSRTLKLKDIAYKMLNLTLGAEINTPVVLKDRLEDLATTYMEISLMADTFNVEDHIDYRIALNEEEGKKALLKLEQAAFLPTISGFINFGYAGFGENFDFLKSEQEWFDSSLIGVSFNLPIFSSMGRNARKQQAKIELDKAQTNISETEQRLFLELETAKTEYNYSVEEYETFKRNLRLAERIEAKQQVKFFEGISTSFELNEAQSQLYRTQQEYLQSMLNVISTKAALDKALNTPIN